MEKEQIEVGSGTFGQVVTSPGCGSCYKTFHSEIPESMFHQMALFQMLRSVAAASPEDHTFIEKHFTLGDHAFRIGNQLKCGFVMPLQCMDLHQYVSDQGVLTGRRLVALHDDVCNAVAWLNRRGIFVCDISPGNTLLGTDERWRLCDFDLWRGSPYVYTPAYSLPLRAPELLLPAGENDPSLQATEAWAVGMTLDFANRGSYVFSSITDTQAMLCAIANFFSHDSTMPADMRQHLADKAPIPFKRTPDWPVYCALLTLDPTQRRLPTDTTTLHWPSAPWRWQFAASGHISPELRAAHCLAITDEVSLEGYAPAQALCAMALIDLHLSRLWADPPATVETSLLIAALFLGNVHTQSLGIADQTISRWTAAFGRATRCQIFDMIEQLSGESGWQCPFGIGLWTMDVTVDMLEEMTNTPGQVYARFQ